MRVDTLTLKPLAAAVLLASAVAAACSEDSPRVDAEDTGSGSTAGSGSLDATGTGNGGTGAAEGGTGGDVAAGSGGGGSSGELTSNQSASGGQGTAQGGVGGTVAENGGTGGTVAGCPDEADQDPRCAGRSAGSFCVGHFKTTCQDMDGDGCLEFEQENCAPGICDAAECSEAEHPEACDSAARVAHSGFTLAGADFGADFEDDFAIGAGECALATSDTPEAVFEVALEEGQTLRVTETGDLDAVLVVQPSCGSEMDCLASDAPEAFEYIAQHDETVTVVVESYFDEPDPAWYRLHIDVDPECGNGVLEGGEACDAGSPPVSPGCTEECTVEFGYGCSETSPSLCEPFALLGPFSAGDSIEDVEGDAPFEIWDRDGWRIEFTEPVVLNLQPRSKDDEGDVNVDLLDESGVVHPFWLTGNTFQEEPVGVLPGTYVLDVTAQWRLPSGYRIELSVSDPGQCGDGTLEKTFEECDTGGEAGCTADCKIDFGFLCSGETSSTCEAIDPLGEFPEDLPVQIVDDPLAVDVSDFWVFSVSEPVTLEVSLTANGSGDPDLFVYSPTGEVAHANDLGAASLTHEFEPGKYEIRVFAYRALEDGYTLTLSAAALDP